MSSTTFRGRAARCVIALAAGLALAASPLAAHAASYPSDGAKPDLVALLNGYNTLWQPSGTNDLHGVVKDPSTLAHDDELTVWINNNATPAQQFRALQDSEYNNSGTAYDQSFTVSQGLGKTLGPLYVKGLNNGSLPLTKALINSSNGSSGAYVSTGAAKTAYSHPRPFLPADPGAQPVAGDAADCAPSKVNSSSLASDRIGKPYADGSGSLSINRVSQTVDTTHEFSPNDVTLNPGYGQAGICTGGSFPSGHTTTAYQAGITLAMLIPEAAPEVLSRTSENGNDRIVLGVHYPLDIIGGRISGEAAIAARWSDAEYRAAVLEPARTELVSYLEKACGATIATCLAQSQPYTADPYAGKAMPGGTAQIVTDRASAVSVFTERLNYAFAPTGSTGLAPAVPAGASNLLLTVFPQLTDAQRTAVLAQTEIASGNPLDQTASGSGSWQRLNLAAAMSATVRLAADGTATVVSTGGTATVIPAPAPTASAPAPSVAPAIKLPVVSG